MQMIQTGQRTELEWKSFMMHGQISLGIFSLHIILNNFYFTHLYDVLDITVDFMFECLMSSIDELIHRSN